jgi:citrate lyase subunit beta/citryl-CoA lyase
VAQARRIVEVYDKALADGVGAVKLDGRMVDVPVADRARAVIALHEAIEARTRH